MARVAAGCNQQYMLRMIWYCIYLFGHEMVEWVLGLACMEAMFPDREISRVACIACSTAR